MHTYVYNRYATSQLKLMRNMHILQKNMVVKRKRLYLYLVYNTYILVRTWRVVSWIATTVMHFSIMTFVLRWLMVDVMFLLYIWVTVVWPIFTWQCKLILLTYFEGCQVDNVWLTRITICINYDYERK